MQKTVDVLCIGTAIADVLITGFQKEQLFKNEMTYADNIAISTGGDAINQSIVLSHLGLRVKLICKLGQDVVGEYVRQNAKNNGVDVSGIVMSSKGKTGINIVLIDKNGERCFLSNLHGTVVETFANSDIDFDALGSARIVSLGSIFIHPKLIRHELEDIFKEAKKCGAITCADLVNNESATGFDDMSNALPYIDYILPNLEEAAYYTRKSEIDDIADAFLKAGVKNVVIKLGARGCLLKSANQRLLVPSYLVTPIDTTGAGDNFVAGFITGISKGYSLEKCCQLANATASIAVQSIGATTGVKNMQDILDVMNSKAIE